LRSSLRSLALGYVGEPEGAGDNAIVVQGQAGRTSIRPSSLLISDLVPAVSHVRRVVEQLRVALSVVGVDVIAEVLPDAFLHRNR